MSGDDLTRWLPHDASFSMYSRQSGSPLLEQILEVGERGDSELKARIAIGWGGKRATKWRVLHVENHSHYATDSYRGQVNTAGSSFQSRGKVLSRAFVSENIHITSVGIYILSLKYCLSRKPTPGYPIEDTAPGISIAPVASWALLTSICLTLCRTQTPRKFDRLVRIQSSMLLFCGRQAPWQCSLGCVTSSILLLGFTMPLNRWQSHRSLRLCLIAMYN